MKSLRLNRESGAVSLFVVIFAMLIITVITVSFLRLMMADQRQATDNDLSQSAYDSAQAGVEDAKRALLRYQEFCSTTTSATDCAQLSEDLSVGVCNQALTIGGIAVPESVPGFTTPGEVKVKQTTSIDEKLDQAYTCVTMTLNTEDYVGKLSAGESQIVPLVGRASFNTVTVRWFSKDDVSNEAGTVVVPPAPSSNLMISQTNWDIDTPAVMRAQLIQFGSSFTMGSFDSTTNEGGETQSNSATAFLYPTNTAVADMVAFTSLDIRKGPSNEYPPADDPALTPRRVQCKELVTSSDDYACSLSLTLPRAIGATSDARTAFLRLTPYYNATSFQVQLSNGDPALATNIVRFKDVQPIIDSTGRANDVFRRVQSRVDLYNTNFPYPDATLDITGNFCKNFAVSDDDSVYAATNTCTP